ncbi:hypothetical protein B0O99DRAFT_703109 [Bisporella sp. PMI_857]|nr:hypothetical protein B0O99DRAFT_703109 [Bisporella sp. PMI_857]
MGEFSASGHGARSIGSNGPGPHPNSSSRPVHYSEWSQPLVSGYGCSPHTLGEQWPGYNGKPFKVIMMGAGAAGIDFLHHSLKALSDLNVEVKCFEKNSDVGGTWYENRYPGCACDGPSASYQFAWRPNPDWSHFYSGSKEIWQYMKSIAVDEGFMDYIQLNTEVKKALWNDDSSTWTLTLAKTDGSEVWDEDCNVFLNGTGFLNAWRWPDIPGLDTFHGRLFHTARFDENYDLTGKRVAVIGSGSSGVQVVASIYPLVSHLYTWVRSPTWITAGFAQKYAGKGGANFEYGAEEKAKWRKDPEKYRKYRKTIEAELNQRYKAVLRNSAESQEANEFSYNEMRTKLGHDLRLVDKVIPKTFNVGCRRPTPGNGYLEALAGEKSTVFTETISRITPSGFIDHKGIEYECDVIICATGFDTSYRPRFPVLGLNDAILSEQWKEVPESYLGIAALNMPNYFMFTGPFTPVAQGSILPLHSALSNYFVKVIRKMVVQHIRQMTPKKQSIDDFMEHCRAYLPRTCWADPCPSWFKQGRVDGPVVMWPGSRISFIETVREPQWEDYDIQYQSQNRFSFLGNGFHLSEFDPNGDITAYLNCEIETAPPRERLRHMMEETRVQMRAAPFPAIFFTFALSLSRNYHGPYNDAGPSQITCKGVRLLSISEDPL